MRTKALSFAEIEERLRGLRDESTTLAEEIETEAEIDQLVEHSQALLKRSQNSGWRERYAAMSQQLAETQEFLDDFQQRWDEKGAATSFNNFHQPTVTTTSTNHYQDLLDKLDAAELPQLEELESIATPPSPRSIAWSWLLLGLGMGVAGTAVAMTLIGRLA